ncbi:DUF2817 domain-containing protein [Bacteriovorax stolpii]|uniref:Peptidase M14 domain-containing protein n=1 Tax=Bacteriovorax stolpii TaxID=960 RepID=A0A2K9NS08_BACTC|nr:DUF2817 domain-containing protein [Bacteriovorax stolpii]AUN98303.1 hypothetical protein C0V70_09340 [Bacteriovorax stolpii]QDK41717.1 DUF2817 domain-containing protein [Bacteriovorax stolpii]TDP52228.1 zinc carboxypeptidase [Bacteriovorax stolpii]
MFKELQEVAKLIQQVEQCLPDCQDLVRTEVLTTITYQNESFPIHAFVIGSEDKTAPTLGLFAGVHGLERVGTHVLLGFLKSFFTQCQWDTSLRESLKNFRIVSIPIINPVGMKLLRRSNGNGVDLMRNSPVEADKGPWYKMYRGHRYGPKYPWYRGVAGQLEAENYAVSEFVKREMFPAKISMGLDFHSGFGLKDRLWFPYAKSSEPFMFRDIVDRAVDLYENTHPHHIYKIEQQSDSYTTHGDLWDYLFFESRKSHPENIFIPWTLEMGSWSWLKKNPIQLFSKQGFFNPVVEHRFQRTMRRHYILIEFITRLMQNTDAWVIKKEEA